MKLTTKKERTASLNRKILLRSLVDELWNHMPLIEYRFHETRKWRFDLAIPGPKLALEIQGLGPGGAMGAHQRIGYMEKEHEKIASAVSMGWRVMFCTWRAVENGTALKWLKAAL